MSGHRIEPIPKTFDFGQGVERLNIMLSYEYISQLNNPSPEQAQNSPEMGQDSSLMDQSGVDSMNVGGTVLGF